MSTRTGMRVRQSRRGDILLCIGFVAVFVFSAMVACWQVRREQYAPGTVCDGVELGGMELSEAEAALREAADARLIRLRSGQGGLLAETTLGALTGSVDLRSQLADILRTQQRELGFLSAGTVSTYDHTLSYAVDADTLRSLLPDVLEGEGFVPHQPKDAELVVDETGAHIVSSDPGNIPDIDECAGALAWYLGQEAIAVDGETELQIENALLKAEIGEDDPVLLAQKKAVDRYLTLTITLNFCGGRCYTLSSGDLLELLDMEETDKNMKVTVREADIPALADRIIEEQGADGREAKYGKCRETRDYVYLKAADNGFVLDRESLYSELTELITTPRSGTVTARYDYTPWLNRTYSWMGDLGTCVEISLDNQYLWFYANGELLTESPVVTGCIADRSNTRAGAFTMYYMVADTVLRGPTWEDHVDYWIPFDGEIGLHDSFWRDEYGGDIYLTAGSHGCVNTPLDAMRIIFENSHMGTPVIVY